MFRRDLTDDQWQLIEALIPGKASDRGVTGKNNRLFVDTVLWIARTGTPWRDVPSECGNWNTSFQRFNRWARAGVWHRLFKALIRDPDFTYRIIDSTIVRAHQHSAGMQKKGLKIRRSAARVAD